MLRVLPQASCRWQRDIGSWASLPPGSELELVLTIERLCSDPSRGQVLWLDLARLIQAVPRRRSMAA